MQVCLRELQVASEPDSSYFLRLDWSGRGLASGFQLLLTDGQEAWRGDVSEAALAAEADELEMHIERYVHDLQEALTTGGPSYTFTLTPPPGRRPSVTLVYEKVQKDICTQLRFKGHLFGELKVTEVTEVSSDSLCEETEQFRFGSVLLTEVPEPTEAVRELLVHSLQRGKVLEEQNQGLEEENQRLRGEQERVTAQLKLYAGGKEALEAELFSRFVLVLNEKKAKIRHLQEAVTHLQEASSEGKKTKDPVIRDRTEEEEEDEYTGSTDEETPAASSSSSRGRHAASPLDDSLNDITDVAPCRKRRFRHLGAAAGPDTVKRASGEESRRKRTDPPPGSSKAPPPRRPAGAASADDLFDDF